MKIFIPLITLAVITLTANGWAMDKSLMTKKISPLEEGYALHNNHCLKCHDSVANPEQPGLTRDRWHLVLNLMHKFGLDFSDDDKEKLIDYLFTIRKGMEKEAG